MIQIYENILILANQRIVLPDISADKLFEAVELVEVNSFVGYRVSDYMQEVLIYGGIGINVLGALFLMAYAMKYAYAFHKSKNEPIRTEAMKPKWAKKRAIGCGLMILGSVIAILGCVI